MKIKSITLAGDSGYTATIDHSTLPEEKLSTDLYIHIRIDDPEGEMHAEHYIDRLDANDMWEAAKMVQHILDGCRGTNSMIMSYANEISRFSWA